MKSNRSTETSPEVRLRKSLWAAGLRGYRKNVRELPGKPDIVFVARRLCIFVHGCFWHGCSECCTKRNLRPTQNAEYWRAKVTKNRERDQLNQARLRELGFQVFVVWECELKGEGINEAMRSIVAALQASGR